jgi:DNA-binding FadR family transcriptional regulator
VGSLERRLARLEDGRRRGDAELSQEALTHLSDEELDALESVLEEALEAGEVTFEYFYRVTSESNRRALDAYFDALEALTKGEEPQAARASPGRDMVALLERIETGDEEALEEWRSRDGYRIWKYR